MKILFLGEYDSSEIIPAPIKVGKELFKRIQKSRSSNLLSPLLPGWNNLFKNSEIFWL